MANAIKGDVVVVPFPFSDLSQTKRRPALVVADLPGVDVLLCQITSQAGSDPDAIVLDVSDFGHGGLQFRSYVRPGRLFAADQNLILYSAAHLRPDKMAEVTARIIEIVTR